MTPPPILKLKIFAREHRGSLADIVVFVVQLLLMRVLVGRFTELVMLSSGDVLAKTILAGFLLALCFLQPIGVLLTRYRMSEASDAQRKDYEKLIDDGGCYYLVGQLILMGTAVNFVFSIFGQQHFFDTVCFLELVLALALAGLNLWIISLFGTKPNHHLIKRILGSVQSEILGDMALILNLVLWQVLWGYLMFGYTTAESAPEEVLWLWAFTPALGTNRTSKFALFILSFTIFYISPRLIYMLRDGRRRLAWLTMLLANLPVLYRLYFGTW